MNTLHPLFTPLTNVMVDGCFISHTGSAAEMIAVVDPIMLFTGAKDFFKFLDPCGMGQQFKFPFAEHQLHHLPPSNHTTQGTHGATG